VFSTFSSSPLSISREWGPPPLCPFQVQPGFFTFFQSWKGRSISYPFLGLSPPSLKYGETLCRLGPVLVLSGPLFHCQHHDPSLPFFLGVFFWWAQCGLFFSLLFCLPGHGIAPLPFSLFFAPFLNAKKPSGIDPPSPFFRA